MFWSIRNSQTRYVLTIKLISIFKETLKLLLNIWIILSSKYFVKNLNKKRKTTEFYFLYCTSSHKTYGKYALFPSQSYCSYLYVLMISSCYRTVPSALWEIFSQFLIFRNLFHEPLGKWSNRKKWETRKIFSKYFRKIFSKVFSNLW